MFSWRRLLLIFFAVFAAFFLLLIALRQNRPITWPIAQSVQSQWIPFTTDDPKWEATRASLRASLLPGGNFQAVQFATVGHYTLATRGKTWVQYALWENNAEAAKWLLAEGFPPDKVPGNESSIVLAMQKHNDALIPMLIKCGAKADMTISSDNPLQDADPSSRDTPIRMAFRMGDATGVDYLLSAGVPLDAPGALGEAARKGDLPMVKLLLAHKMPIDDRIMVGTENDQLTWRRVSREYRLVSLSGRPFFGSLPMMPVTAVLAQPVVENLANIEQENAVFSDDATQPDNSKVLMEAAKGIKISPNRREIVKLFIAAGCDPHQRLVSTPYTPLFFAAACDDTEMVNLLIKHGANIDTDVPADVRIKKAWDTRHPSDPLPLFQF
jgi:ankyrin repeat protein